MGKNKKFIITESQCKKLINYSVNNFKYFLNEESKTADKRKADYVSDDVNKFFNILKSIKNPLVQQKKGSMTYQRDVEAFQIALTLLGYPLPKYGIDGYFGSETAESFKKFAKDYNIDIDSKITESVTEFQPTANIEVEKGVDAIIDDNLQKLITNIQSEFGRPIKIISGYRDPERNRRIGGSKKSAHLRNNAVDVSFRGGRDETLRFIEIASKLGAGGIGVYRPGVVHIDLEDRRAWGPNFSSSSIPRWSMNTIQKHLNGEFSSGSKILPTEQRSTGVSTATDTVSVGSTQEIKPLSVTPEVISKMVDLLKQKNIKSGDLLKYVNILT